MCFHIIQGALKIFFDIISLIQSVAKMQVHMETYPRQELNGILYFQTCVTTISTVNGEFSRPRFSNAFKN